MSKEKYYIGLEIHTQLKTKLKLFSRAANQSNRTIANTNVDLLDMGYPGIFPQLNCEAVRKAHKVCQLFQCTVSQNLVFDRKHYMYPDLPLGYQITQYHHPIGLRGIYHLMNYPDVIISDVHIETDAGKIKEYDQKVAIDLNRCGVPLVEIVTSPCIESYEQIEELLLLLINDLRLNNLGDARMEEGNLRVDVNISREDLVSGVKSPRLEIKNLNSLKAIKRSIILAKHMLANTIIENSCTLSFDEINDKLIIMRIKESPLDYMYMFDPAIPSIPMASIIEQTEEVTKTLFIIKNLYKRVPNLSLELVKKITFNNVLLGIAKKILMIKEIAQYENSMSFISEVSEMIDNTDEIHYANIESYILEGVLILYKKQCTKVKIISSLQEMHNILHQGKQSHKTLYDFLKSINAIFDTTNSLTLEYILSFIKDREPDLIAKIQLNNKKAINYTIGLIMKHYPQSNPRDIKQLVYQIITPHHDE